MGYLGLARKYRPQVFEEVIGQDYVTRTLKNAIKENRVSHAYLFAGPRGVGKTSTARILAKALNCEKGPTPTPCNKCENCKEITRGASLDVLEIDGATNRRVEEISVINENTKFAPAKSRFKIYIIDEVHMLTDHAFNSLLKTLEEPPSHVKFIFATTRPGKVLSTIVSRCQRFDFRLLSADEIYGSLKEISEKENIGIEEKALFQIARVSSGSFRDGLGILDQLFSFKEKKEIKEEDVIELLGLVEDEVFKRTIKALLSRDNLSIFQIVDEIVSRGKDLIQLYNGLIEHLRYLLLSKIGKEADYLIKLPQEVKDSLLEEEALITEEQIIYLIENLSAEREEIKREGLNRVAVEVSLFSLSKNLPGKKKEESKKEIKKEEIPQVKEEIVTIREKTVEVDEKENLEGELKKIWPSLIKEIGSKKRLLADSLKEAKVEETDGKIIVFYFDHSYHRDWAEKDKIILGEILERHLGKKFRLKFLLSPEKRVDKPEEKREEPPPSLENLTLGEERKVKEVLEAFKGKIIKRTKI